MLLLFNFFLQEGLKEDKQYAYNGESYNPNISAIYLRARYYSTETASFLTEDSYLGDITEPLTLNRYSYGLGSPYNYIDPSGHVPLPMNTVMSDGGGSSRSATVPLQKTFASNSSNKANLGEQLKRNNILNKTGSLGTESAAKKIANQLPGIAKPVPVSASASTVTVSRETVGDKIWGALCSAGDAVSSAVNWGRDRIGDAIDWGSEQVSNAIAWGGDRLNDLKEWAASIDWEAVGQGALIIAGGTVVIVIAAAAVVGTGGAARCV